MLCAYREMIFSSYPEVAHTLLSARRTRGSCLINLVTGDESHLPCVSDLNECLCSSPRLLGRSYETVSLWPTRMLSATSALPGGQAALRKNLRRKGNSMALQLTFDL